MTREQAILFIDGSNFFHSARNIGIVTGALDYQAMAHKLVLGRNLAGIRYYVGKVSGDIFRERIQDTHIFLLGVLELVVVSGHQALNLR